MLPKGVDLRASDLLRLDLAARVRAWCAEHTALRWRSHVKAVSDSSVVGVG
jgi:hypothetical protein